MRGSWLQLSARSSHLCQLDKGFHAGLPCLAFHLLTQRNIVDGLHRGNLGRRFLSHPTSTLARLALPCSLTRSVGQTQSAPARERTRGVHFLAHAQSALHGAAHSTAPSARASGCVPTSPRPRHTPLMFEAFEFYRQRQVVKDEFVSPCA